MRASSPRFYQTGRERERDPAHQEVPPTVKSPVGAARRYFNSIKEKRTYTGVVLLFLQRGCHE